MSILAALQVLLHPAPSPSLGFQGMAGAVALTKAMRGMLSLYTASVSAGSGGLPLLLCLPSACRFCSFTRSCSAACCHACEGCTSAQVVLSR